MSSLIAGLETIADNFDAFVVDLWGVMHNGKKPYPKAVDCLKYLKEIQKPVILLSNAPRRLTIAEARLTELGIERALYDSIYTSGEDCHCHLRDRSDEWYQNLGDTFYHLGPERDRTIFQGLPLQEVKKLKDADFLLNTGTLTWEDKVSDHEDLFQEAMSLELPMICANPDRVVLFGDQLVLAAGALAERYQKLGGYVRYHGKPYPDIYQSIFALLPEIASQRILAIGDSLATDIKGAKGVAIPSLFIMGGIHSNVLQSENAQGLEERLHNLFDSYQIKPDYALPQLRW